MLNGMCFRLKTSGWHLCKHRYTFKVFSLELCRPHHLSVATLLIPKIAHAFLKFYIFAFVDGCHNCNWVKKVNLFVESHSSVLGFTAILGLGVIPFPCNYRNILNRMVGTGSPSRPPVASGEATLPNSGRISTSPRQTAPPAARQKTPVRCSRRREDAEFVRES
jgi:hypothetical protein